MEYHSFVRTCRFVSNSHLFIGLSQIMSPKRIFSDVYNVVSVIKNYCHIKILGISSTNKFKLRMDGEYTDFFISSFYYVVNFVLPKRTENGLHHIRTVSYFAKLVPDGTL